MYMYVPTLFGDRKREHCPHSVCRRKRDYIEVRLQWYERDACPQTVWRQRENIVPTVCVEKSQTA